VKSTNYGAPKSLFGKPEERKILKDLGIIKEKEPDK
jgi:hypothetical protein